MRILIVLIRFSGGVGRANTEIAKALRKKGHEVDLLSRENDLKKFSFTKGFWAIRKKVTILMEIKKYDVIYTQDFSCALPILIPYPIYFKKHFYCSIGVKWKRDLSQAFQNIVGGIMGKKTIVISDHNKKRFPKAHLVYRGVNLETFKPLRKKRKHFGFMNKFSEQVSPERYEKIAKELKLISISSGEAKTKKIKRSFTQEGKHSFDKIPDDKMNEFYNKCKVFINLATPDAGFNLSWLEAMAAGVPIVIGNNNGAGPMLPFDKIDNLDNLEGEIKKIIKNPKKINYRKWIIGKGFTWDKVADKLLMVFENEKKNS